jgi:hypothetical protein
VLVLAGVVAASYRLQKKAHRELKQAYDDLAEKKAEVYQERAVSARLREIDRLKAASGSNPGGKARDARSASPSRTPPRTCR